MSPRGKFIRQGNPYANNLTRTKKIGPCFTGMPDDIRCKILRLLLVSPEPIQLDLRRKCVGPREYTTVWSGVSGLHPSICCVNFAIGLESIRILYGDNVFDFDFVRQPQIFIDHLSRFQMFVKHINLTVYRRGDMACANAFIGVEEDVSCPTSRPMVTYHIDMAKVLIPQLRAFRWLQEVEINVYGGPQKMNEYSAVVRELIALKLEKLTGFHIEGASKELLRYIRDKREEIRFKKFSAEMFEVPDEGSANEEEEESSSDHEEENQNQEGSGLENRSVVHSSVESRATIVPSQARSTRRYIGYPQMASTRYTVPTTTLSLGQASASAEAQVTAQTNIPAGQMDESSPSSASPHETPSPTMTGEPKSKRKFTLMKEKLEKVFKPKL